MGEVDLLVMLQNHSRQAWWVRVTLVQGYACYLGLLKKAYFFFFFFCWGCSGSRIQLVGFSAIWWGKPLVGRQFCMVLSHFCSSYGQNTDYSLFHIILFHYNLTLFHYIFKYVCLVSSLEKRDPETQSKGKDYSLPIIFTFPKLQVPLL